MLQMAETPDPASLDRAPSISDSAPTPAQQPKPKGNPLIGQQIGGRFAAQRERFCQAYVGLSFGGKGKGNATQSAILAGYSESTAASQASRLLRDPGIRARVNELTLKLAERVLSETPEQEVEDPQFPFAVLHDVAKSGRNETARVRAAELLGKQKHGYWQDKLTIDLQAMPDTELLAAVARFAPGQAEVFAAVLRRSRGELIEAAPERSENPDETKD